MNYNQKTQSASPSHWTKLAVLFWLWMMLLRPTVKTGHLFQCYSSKSKFHHLWQYSLKSFHQHLHSWEAICWHQQIFDSDLHSAGVAQIWLQHEVCSYFKWESHETWFIKFHLPLILHEQSNDNWNGSLSELFRWSFHFFLLKVIQNVLCPHSWISVVLLASYPNTCFNILKVFRNCFP
jgi:hypothetical protein